MKKGNLQVFHYLLITLFMSIMLGQSTKAWAQATVQTDKSDYLPGEVVIITGDGWLADEPVTLNIQHIYYTSHPDETWTTTAGSTGLIFDNGYMIDPWDLGETFLLTATGQTSGYVATTTFTDGDAADGDGAMTVNPLFDCMGGSGLTYTFTFTGGNGNKWNNGSQLTMEVPWLITLSNIVVNGYVNNPTIGSITVGSSPLGSLITIPFYSNQNDPKFNIVINGVMMSTDSYYDIPVKTKQAGGVLTPIDESPFIVSSSVYDGYLVGSLNSCNSTANGSFKLVGYTGTIVKWEVSTLVNLITDEWTPWTTLQPAGNGPNYNLNNIDVTTRYRVETTGGCNGSTHSNIAMVALGTSPAIVAADITDYTTYPLIINLNEHVHIYSIVPLTSVSYYINYETSSQTEIFSPYTFPAGTTTVTVVAVNMCNTTVTSFNVTSGTAPTFTACPGNINQNNDAGLCSAVVSYTAIAVGPPAPTISYTFTGATTGSGSGTGSGSTFNKGTTTVTLTATNGIAPDATCSFTVTVVDNENPQITTEATDQTVECDGTGNSAALASWLNSHGGASATDNCGTINWTYTPNPAVLSNECGATGSVTVTFRATDLSNNFAETTATFTIEDTENPSWTNAPEDLTVECDGYGNTAELSNWLASFSGGDVCGDATVTDDFTALSDGCGATGSATVTFTLTDECGNFITQEATFTIVDTQAPVITPITSTLSCSGSISVETEPGECTYTAGTEFDVNAADVCQGAVTASWSITDANGTRTGTGSLDGIVFIPGATTVTWTAEDDCGNESTCSFTVNVQVATITTAYTSAGQARYMDEVTLFATIVTNCPGYELTGNIEFQMDGETVGYAPAYIIPEGEQGAGTTLRATLLYQIAKLPKGSGPVYIPYTVKAIFTPGNSLYTGSNGETELTVLPREASPLEGSAGFYTGPLYSWTTGPNSSTATITLSAVIKDNNTPTGDVRGALVTFYYFNNGNLTPIPSAQNLPVGLIDQTDGTVGAANAIVQFNIGNWNALDFDIAVGISGGYENDPFAPESRVLITVSKPVQGGYIMGGGQLENTSATNGLIKGAIGAEFNTEFSFDVKYNKKGTNPQGDATIKIYSWYDANGLLDDHIHTYHVKSNAIAVLAVNKPNDPNAYFSAKATLKEELDGGVMISLEGNNTLQLWMTDPGNDGDSWGTPDPGNHSTLGIQLDRKNGGIWFSSNWNGTKTVEQQIFTGSQLKVAPASAARSGIIDVIASDANAGQSLTVYPNPTNGITTFRFVSSNEGRATLELFNINGSMISTLYESEVKAGQTYEVSYNPVDQQAGMILYRLIIGNEVINGKLMIQH